MKIELMRAMEQMVVTLMGSELKEYFINYDKSRDACSIIWQSDKYNINELEPYIYTIQCDDGENFYDLINAEWPDSNGRDDFKTIELNNFEVIEGDEDKEYLLCFTALVGINFDNNPDFYSALYESNNQIVARIQFKKDGKPLADVDGYQEYLFEMNIDNSVALEGDDDLAGF